MKVLEYRFVNVSKLRLFYLLDHFTELRLIKAEFAVISVDDCWRFALGATPSIVVVYNALVALVEEDDTLLQVVQ